MNKDFNLATFAGGCFWCTEAIFNRIKGVISTTPGYSGGTKENPTYDEVSSGTTGHVEAIQIKFDPSIIPYEKLLDVFWNTHNPTTLNQQGNDFGTQYRSVIFYHDDEQREKAETSRNLLNTTNYFHADIVTEIIPFTKFYIAENYHKNYYDNHKDALYCKFVINPKINKLLKEFKKEIKEEYQ